MDLRELAKLDLKTIDLSKAGDFVKVHLEFILRLFLVTVLLCALYQVVGAYLERVNKLHQEISALEEKFSQVLVYEKSKGDLNKFLQEVPKSINDDAVVNLITDWAVKNQVDVVSLTPGQKSSDKFAQFNKIRFKLKAKQYKDVALFIRNLESSGYALRVEAINLSLEQAGSELGRMSINVQVEILFIRLLPQKNV